jgi:hypothetical protein
VRPRDDRRSFRNSLAHPAACQSANPHRIS